MCAGEDFEAVRGAGNRCAELAPYFHLAWVENTQFSRFRFFGSVPQTPFPTTICDQKSHCVAVARKQDENALAPCVSAGDSFVVGGCGEFCELVNTGLRQLESVFSGCS
jgi:hypothetical protein